MLSIDISPSISKQLPSYFKCIALIQHLAMTLNSPLKYTKLHLMKKGKHNRRKRKTERLSSYNEFNCSARRVPAWSRNSLFTTSSRHQLERLTGMTTISKKIYLLSCLLSLSLSITYLSPSLTFLSLCLFLSLYCTCFCRISGTAFSLENMAAWKRYGI